MFRATLYQWLLPRAIEVMDNNMKQFHLFTQEKMLTFTATAKLLLHYVSCGKMCACYGHLLLTT